MDDDRVAVASPSDDGQSVRGDGPRLAGHSSSRLSTDSTKASASCWSIHDRATAARRQRSADRRAAPAVVDHAAGTVTPYRVVMSAPLIRLIVPHFGQRPSYLSLVLRSMAHNPDVHWLLLTDRPVADVPSNVAVQLGTFADMVARIRGCFDFPISLERPYKLCDFRPAFGEIFSEELAGYDFWGHCDLDVIFGRIREHLPPEAFNADKVLFQGNFALYRNTAEAAAWFRHETDGVSYRQVMMTPEAMHFDEWAGIYRIVRDLGVRYWQQDRIFDLSFSTYRTRAETADGDKPRRYAWEHGEVAEYRLRGGEVLRQTGLLVHLQKRTMRPPTGDVLDADRYWILANGFTVQNRISPWRIRAATIPFGHEMLPFYWRRIRRNIRRHRARTRPAGGTVKTRG